MLIKLKGLPLRVNGFWIPGPQVISLKMIFLFPPTPPNIIVCLYYVLHLHRQVAAAPGSQQHDLVRCSALYPVLFTALGSKSVATCPTLTLRHMYKINKWEDGVLKSLSRNLSNGRFECLGCACLIFISSTATNF